MYRVLRDTSEHENKGWLFEPSEICLGTREANLYTGDYSLEGFYDSKLFVIERKGRVSEFVANLTQKEKWDDFKQELERLEEFAHPFILLEFPISLLMSYPRGSGIPTSMWGKIRVRPQFVLKRLLEIQLAFKSKILFVDSHGVAVASSLFKRMCERYEHAYPA